MNLAKFLKTVSTFCLDALFPPICLACRRRLKAPSEKILFLCGQCQNKISIHSHLFCPDCGNRISPISPTCGEPRRTISPTCHPNSFPLLAPSSYENPVARKLIHALKYQNLKTAMIPIKELIIKPFTKKIFENCKLPLGPELGVEGKIENCTLVPIPLHKQKERRRGFNQAELIATALAECLSEISPISRISPISPISRIGPIGPIRLIKRTRSTRTQTELPDYKSRAENVHDCFQITENCKLPLGPELGVEGKIENSSTIVLVDDVLTSGATMKEAVKTLKSAGFKNIIAFVIAKT